jgi:hypothetical protein
MPDAEERSGIRGWLELFASELVHRLGADERPRFFELVEREARAALFREGVWWMDYVRLRVTAERPGPLRVGEVSSSTVRIPRPGRTGPKCCRRT